MLVSGMLVACCLLLDVDVGQGVSGTHRWPILSVELGRTVVGSGTKAAIATTISCALFLSVCPHWSVTVHASPSVRTPSFLHRSHQTPYLYTLQLDQPRLRSHG